jgi:hypothetical protein
VTPPTWLDANAGRSRPGPPVPTPGALPAPLATRYRAGALTEPNRLMGDGPATKSEKLGG